MTTLPVHDILLFLVFCCQVSWAVLYIRARSTRAEAREVATLISGMAPTISRIRNDILALQKSPQRPCLARHHPPQSVFWGAFLLGVLVGVGIGTEVFLSFVK